MLMVVRWSGVGRSKERQFDPNSMNSGDSIPFLTEAHFASFPILLAQAFAL